MQPTRHAYGALLLEQGRVEEAAAGVCRRPRAGSHPGPAVPASGQCLEPARLSRVPAAAGPRRPRRASSDSNSTLALARADVPIRASCACRLEVARTALSPSARSRPGSPLRTLRLCSISAADVRVPAPVRRARPRGRCGTADEPFGRCWWTRSVRCASRTATGSPAVDATGIPNWRSRSGRRTPAPARTGRGDRLHLRRALPDVRGCPSPGSAWAASSTRPRRHS